MQKGKLDHLTFRRRIVLIILEGIKERLGLSSFENLESRYDYTDHLTKLLFSVS